MTPPQTAAQEALTAVKRATDARRQAESAWRAAIRHAAATCTMRQIAEATDVSHTRVFQLVSGRDRDLT